MQLFTALLSALALASSATALPAPAAIRRSENIVISPPIFSPRAGDIWPINSVQTVEWDTTMFTGSAQNNSGTILLGHNDGTESENLDSNALASGFLLSSGKQTVTVPSVPAGTTYFVVLMGDSGNESPQFTIQ